MTYTPKRNLLPLSVSIMTLTASALILAGFSTVADGIAVKAMIMTSAIILFGEILLITRFILIGFAYKVMDFEFSAIKSYGKKQTTVCRLYYTDITAVLPYNKAKKQLKGKYIHNYCVSVAPKNKLCLFFQTESEDGVVIIEADDTFKKHLDKYVRTDITNI